MYVVYLRDIKGLTFAAIAEKTKLTRQRAHKIYKDNKKGQSK